MSTHQEGDIWTVLVVAEDPAKTKIYRLSKDIAIAHVVLLWKNDFDIHGNFVPRSDNHDIDYDPDFTIEMIGETSPGSKTVTMRVEQAMIAESNQWIEIFVNTRNKCHSLFVEKCWKLGRVLSRFRGEEFEFNGKILDLKQNVGQAGLLHGSVIYEACCRIAVKFSTGAVNLVSVPKDAIVSQLKVEVCRMEKLDVFNLRYNGRFLHPDETVSGLTRLVEVCTSEIRVEIDGQTYTWKTGSEFIEFGDFLVELTEASSLDLQFIERYSFCCQKCGCTVRKSEDECCWIQRKCYGANSLYLKAELEDKSKGVRLMLLYDSSEFKPKMDHPEFRSQGNYEWCPRPFIKCEVSDLRAGWVSFETMKAKLGTFFTKSTWKSAFSRAERVEFRQIGQVRGKASYRSTELAAVTSLANDDIEEVLTTHHFCDIYGDFFPHVENTEFYSIREEGKILLCGGGRRTILSIFKH